MVKMRYALALLVALVAIPSASADHDLPFHWPSTTVAVNGGTCVQPCRWIRVVDKTGKGTQWRNDVLKKALTKFASGTTSSTWQFTVVGGTKATCGPTTCNAQLQQTAIGTLAVVNWTGIGAGTADAELCGENMVEPYCSGDEEHVTRGLLLLGGGGGTVLYSLVWHEAGHVLGGLADTDFLSPPPCGVGGKDIMCGSGYTFWNAHSKALLNAKYGHID